MKDNTFFLLIIMSMVIVFLFIGFIYMVFIHNNKKNNETQKTITELKDYFNNSITNLNNHLSNSVIGSLNNLSESNQNFAVKMSEINAKLEDNKELKVSLDIFSKILNNKQDRGYFGEQQLEVLIGDIIPKDYYLCQYTLKNNSRADFVIKLPKDLILCIDSKFPLESYMKIIDNKTVENEKLFIRDIKKHIDDISSKYIVKNETMEYAVMYLPSESLFVEIMTNHKLLNNYAYSKKVILTSPNTIIAILSNTIAMIKDEIIQKQQLIIQDNLSKILKDFERMKKRKEDLNSIVNNLNNKIEEINISEEKMVKNIEKIVNLDLN